MGISEEGLRRKQRHPGYCLGCLYEIIVRKDALQSEANAEFVDHVATAAFVGRKEVEVDFGAGGKDEPAVLGADGKVATETIHVVDGFVEHHTGDNTEIPAVFVVFIDVAEFDGENDGVSGGSGFFDIVGGCSDFIARDAEVAVAEDGVTISETDVEVPTAGNGAMVVKGDT